MEKNVCLWDKLSILVSDISCTSQDVSPSFAEEVIGLLKIRKDVIVIGENPMGLIILEG
jgi:hypothetical protein